MTTTTPSAVRTTIVRYTVAPGRVEDNLAAIRAVYDELGATRPPGFRYATVLLEDGVTFVHTASGHEGDGAPLTGLASFRAFRSGLAERCASPPEQWVATVSVGRYDGQEPSRPVTSSSRPSATHAAP